jgi:precorrin-6B methylase 2
MGRTLTDKDGNSTPMAPGLTWLSSGASTVKERLPLARYLGMLPAQDATFVDIGAGEGLFSVYLAENFSHVIAYESAAFSDLRTNLAVNGLAHVQAIHTALPAEDDAVWSRDDVALLRIDATDPCTILRRAEKLLETSRPLVFIQAFASPEDEACCASLLALHGYTIQHVFTLMPQCAIAATAAHSDRYPWLL